MYYFEKPTYYYNDFKLLLLTLNLPSQSLNSPQTRNETYSFGGSPMSS